MFSLSPCFRAFFSRSSCSSASRTIASVSSAWGRLDIVKQGRDQNRAERAKREAYRSSKQSRVEAIGKRRRRKKRFQKTILPNLSLSFSVLRSPLPSDQSDAAPRLRLGHGHAARRDRRRACRRKQARDFDVACRRPPSPIEAVFLGAAAPLCCPPDRLQRCANDHLWTRLHAIADQKRAKEDGRRKSDLVLEHSIALASSSPSSSSHVSLFLPTDLLLFLAPPKKR